MAKKVLIIDAGIKFIFAGGTLNHTYANRAAELFTGAGWEVDVTRLEDESWKTEDEVKKLAAADLVFVQTPAWWMGPPWQFKKWMDEVFTNSDFGDDGRTHTAPELNYGRGGNYRGHFLISQTWNAPLNAFVDPKEFFEGKGVDAVLYPVRKAFEFIGLTGLETFMANDVIKNPTFDSDMERFEAYVRDVIETLA